MDNYKSVLLGVKIIAVTLVITCSNLSAQTYEEFVKQREKDFEEYKQKEEKAFKEFREERDKAIQQMDSAYTEYLKQRWEEFQVFAGKKPPARPKPLEQPVLQEKPEHTSSNPLKTKGEGIQKTEKRDEDINLPVFRKSTPETYPKLSASVSFYGKQSKYQYDKDFITEFPSVINEEIIADQWDKMNKTHYTDLIEQLFNTKDELNLNDWGYYLLLKNTSARIAPHSKNAQRFLQWFLLVKSNYKVKLGYRGNDLFILIPSINEIYDVPFFTFNNTKYYSINGTDKKIYTYKKDFPEARQLLDLNLYSPLNLPDKPVEKTYNFNYDEKEETIKIQYNQNLIDFYKDYPLADIKVYFNASASALTKESLLESLTPVVENKSEEEAVNYLLHLVQKSFDYKTDQEQFGYENFFFPEEIFHYPYSDCEDRSVFFSYLVKELLGLKVIGLGYSDHMATAVNFNEHVEGDYLEYKNNRYVICDPTYMNAPVGKIQPEYRNEDAEIIELLNNQYQAKIAETIRNKIIEGGGNNGSSSDNIVFDEKGNAYVTGYFSGDMKIEPYHVRSVNRSNDMFIAKFNQDGRIQWLRNFGGKGNEIGYSVRMDEKNQNIYVAGSFTDDLIFGSNTFKAGEKGDVFLTKLTPGGEIVWANQSGIKSPVENDNFMFTSNFSSDGELKWTRLYEEMESYSNFGIELDEAGEPYIKGAIYATPGFETTTRSFDAYTEFDYLETLKSENDKLLENNYDPSIAGLFAVINLIQNSGSSLPGELVQEALDQYNPSFRKKSPSIYKNIGKVRFIKNSKGIIDVRTDNGKAVDFSYLRINDNSKLKIFRYTSGNAQINVLSGIRVGKAIVWYNLNHIRLFHQTGDLLFDFDEDHTQKKVNLRKDILQ